MMIVKNSHEPSELSSIKDAVIKLLEKHPSLTAKPICRILGLNFKDYGSYINNIKTNWKNSLKFRQALKVHPQFKIHGFRAWIYVKHIKKEDALKVGWILTKMKNKALLWKDPKGLGRMLWFWTTGRVNIHLKPPIIRGRLYQLFCNGFSMTGLIQSMPLLGRLLEGIRMKKAHYVFDLKKRMPYMVVDLFKTSNGLVVRSGDKTHPHGIELEISYPDWAEKNERLLGQIYKMMQPEIPETSPQEPKPYYVS
jgi:hypothetical protein